MVERASDDPSRFAVGARLLAAGEEVEVVESKRAGGGRLVVRLDRPVPRGTPLEVPRESLPVPDEDAYYVYQLVGLRVEEAGGRDLGRVADVIGAPANDVLELDTGLLLPLVGACVREVDLQAGRIVVEPGYAGADADA
ncbi:MAG TPA: ribosome maturation factor RimM [Gaiellaceae bacterium]|nr:ribosome maturation factor RimM [Gaiellaceae bacterium]